MAQSTVPADTSPRGPAPEVVPTDADRAPEQTVTSAGDERFAGLSIGDDVIYAVVIDAGRHVVDACAGPTPVGAVVDGAVTDVDALADALGELVGAADLAGLPATCALRPPGSWYDATPPRSVVPRPAFDPEPFVSHATLAIEAATRGGLRVVAVEHALAATVRALSPTSRPTGLVVLADPAPGLALVVEDGQLVTGTAWRAASADQQFWPLERTAADVLLRGGLEQRIALLTKIVRTQAPIGVPWVGPGDGLAAGTPVPIPSALVALGAALGSLGRGGMGASDRDATPPHGPSAAVLRPDAAPHGDSATGAPGAAFEDLDEESEVEVEDPSADGAPAATTATAAGAFVAAGVAAGVVGVGAGVAGVGDPDAITASGHGDRPQPVAPARDSLDPAPPPQARTAASTSGRGRPNWSRRRAAAGGVVAIALAAGVLGSTRLRDAVSSEREDDDLSAGVTTGTSPSAATDGSDRPSGTVATVVAVVAARPVAVPTDAAGSSPESGGAAPRTAPGTNPAGGPTPDPATTSAPTPTPTTVVPGSPPPAPTTTTPASPPATPTTVAGAFSPPGRPGVIDGVPVNTPQTLRYTDRSEEEREAIPAALTEILLDHPSWSIRIEADGTDAGRMLAAAIVGQLAADGIEPGRVTRIDRGAAEGTITIWILAPENA